MPTVSRCDVNGVIVGCGLRNADPGERVSDFREGSVPSGR